MVARADAGYAPQVMLGMVKRLYPSKPWHVVKHKDFGPSDKNDRPSRVNEGSVDLLYHNQALNDR